MIVSPRQCCEGRKHIFELLQVGLYLHNVLNVGFDIFENNVYDVNFVMSGDC